MRHALYALIGFFASAQALIAQVQQTQQTTQLVQDVTKAFFAQLPKDSFEAERAYMAKGLLETVNAREWAASRKYLRDQLGTMVSYTPYNLTYYSRESLLAAVDFSGKGNKADTYVCGFVLWEIPEPNEIGLLRIEENVVSQKLFRKMPLQQAAQLMSDWRCPAQLIESVLGVSINASKS